jgi:hypothetical protein
LTFSRSVYYLSPFLKKTNLAILPTFSLSFQPSPIRLSSNPGLRLRLKRQAGQKNTASTISHRPLPSYHINPGSLLFTCFYLIRYPSTRIQSLIKPPSYSFLFFTCLGNITLPYPTLPYHPYHPIPLESWDVPSWSSVPPPLKTPCSHYNPTPARTTQPYCTVPCSVFTYCLAWPVLAFAFSSLHVPSARSLRTSLVAHPSNDSLTKKSVRKK